jgi:Flp pilus assembly protein TadG
VRRRLRDERGVALVEFAIIFPVLMLILVGTIQIGVFIYTLDDVREATSEGGRVLTTSRNDSNGEQNVENKIAASVSGEVDRTKLSYTFSSQPPWAPGTTVTMTVTYPDALNVMGIDISDGPIKATAKVSVE